MDLKKYKLSSVQYKITKCEVSAPKLKEPFSVNPMEISEFMIDDDYEVYYYPYFQINMQLPIMVERAIKQTPNEIYINIEIEEQYFSDRTGQQTTPDSVSKFISGKFIAYLEDQTRSIMDKQIEELEEKLGYNANSLDARSMVDVKFTLYNDKLIKALGTNINAVITSGTLVNILAYVLTTAGISNVLLSPPNNNKTYRQFILPPEDAQDHIERICHHYGLHTNGSLIYHGLDRSYILDRQPKCTAYSTNEYQTTFLYYQGGADNSINIGCGKNSSDKTNLLLIQPATFIFNDMSVAADETLSSKLNRLTPWSGGASSDGDIAMSIGGDDTTKAIERATKAYSKVVKMSFNNIDLLMLTPNKKFTINMDDVRYKAYTGDYMLVKSSSVFLKTGSSFSPITNCTFKC